jgi:hypothetical protein
MTALHDSRPKHETQPAADPEIQGSQGHADLENVACRRSYGVVSEAASFKDMESRAKTHEVTRDNDDNLRDLRATRAPDVEACGKRSAFPTRLPQLLLLQNQLHLHRRSKTKTNPMGKCSCH